MPFKDASERASAQLNSVMGFFKKWRTITHRPKNADYDEAINMLENLNVSFNDMKAMVEEAPAAADSTDQVKALEATVKDLQASLKVAEDDAKRAKADAANWEEQCGEYRKTVDKLQAEKSAAPEIPSGFFAKLAWVFSH